MFDGLGCLTTAIGFDYAPGCAARGINYQIWVSISTSPVVLLIAGVILGVSAAVYILRRILPGV